jgi:molybdate transport system substrate-binding protein
MSSGGFTAAYKELVPQFERSNHDTVTTAFGPSMGNTPDSISQRLERHEPADVVILASTVLDDLIKHGFVQPGSRVDLARSGVGVAVRAGAPLPDISSAAALKAALLRAKSIAYSSSASGVYVSTVLFPRLGISEQIRSKCQRVEGLVGPVVANGGAEIGFQQISELRPIAGITLVGPLPPEVQHVTVYSAGLGANASDPAAARALIAFLASPAAEAAIRKSGLEPPVRQAASLP